MPRALNGTVELEYDTFGQKRDRPLLLVMGLGAQMIAWREGFCEQLAGLGHYVLRYDNRDVGLSTKFDDFPMPSMAELVAQRAAGKTPQVPYTLSDMADDGMAVLDAEGLATAHICGASMGGMIVQAMALQHRSRIRTLTSIMSSTGSPGLPPARPSAMAALTAPPAQNREEAMDRAVANGKVIGSPGFPADPAETRDFAARVYDRSFTPLGTARQMAAVGANGNRRPALEQLSLPALVIHGRDDPLVPVECGIDTYHALSGSDLLIIGGMGHDLPKALWQRIAQAINGKTTECNS